jgi:hypothetical protein
LRPLINFEQYYQGEEATNVLGSASVPVPFFSNTKTVDPNYKGLDVDAGKEGFDPNLLDFIPVPMGCLIKVWIPFFTAPEDVENFQTYRYMFNWRVSDIRRYVRALGGQYHLPTESFGAPDTTGGTPSPRFVTPAATRSIIVNKPEEPAVNAQSNSVRREYLVVRAGEQPQSPLLRLPGGGPTDLGVYQQGVIDPALSPGFGSTPVFTEFEIVAGGDRLLLTVDRFGERGEPVGPSAWDFEDGGADSGFSVFYGTGALSDDFKHPVFPDVGVYLFFGSAP